MDASMLLVVLGGLIEPVWVMALKKLDSERSVKWALITAFFAILSPALMGLGMDSMGVGVAYAVWTGIGAVCTMMVGYFAYGDRVGAARMVCVGMIVAGVVGLNLVSGGA